MARSSNAQADGRYLQLWLTFEWPPATDRVPVGCPACGWTGRRIRRAAASRACPSCGERTTRTAVGPGGRQRRGTWSASPIGRNRGRSAGRVARSGRVVGCREVGQAQQPPEGDPESVGESASPPRVEALGLPGAAGGAATGRRCPSRLPVLVDQKILRRSASSLPASFTYRAPPASICSWMKL